MNTEGQERPKTYLERCYTIRYEGEMSTVRRSTRQENIENENSMQQNREKTKEERTIEEEDKTNHLYERTKEEEDVPSV